MKEKKIFIQLLGEGTKVYRPVPAYKIEKNVFKIAGYDLYDSDEEIWEFTPGTIVFVEKQNLEGEFVLVAIKGKDK